MTLNETSSIRFSVEESVWFKKGQEVSNLISMSLDPEISVQEHEDYISIRGALVLTGEYYPSETQESEQEDISFREFSAVRTVDEVIENEGGVNNINHRFPVDITIPANRIKSLDEVFVLVESFDYEIPNQGQLQLTADLSISGIINERVSNQAEPESHENETVVAESASETEPEWEEPILTPASAHREINAAEDEPEADTEVAEEKFATFFSEARKDPIEDEQESQEISVTKSDAYTLINESESTNEIKEELEVATAREEEQQEPQQQEIQEEEQQEEPIVQSRSELVEEEVEVAPAVAPSPQIEMKGRRSEDDSFGWNPSSLYSGKASKDSEEDNDDPSAEEQQQQYRPRHRSENALYLTKMLASGEEDFSKLRMRIVQNGETLGSIAESYDVSPNQIIRMNGLEDDVIEEGQILYIPEYAGVE
ncbi:stage VI sporulation protein D [Bacillus sp. Marseille-P3661]|uniref:stage VI sporulation protein D n=1 Tax=Bacillus sp. Marseille-P3661 TaxID=1936234 RepID=UPI000C81F927|nr:stage VI sporulation protein D [Bacillus sp. Marseille-P3661]